MSAFYGQSAAPDGGGGQFWGSKAEEEEWSQTSVGVFKSPPVLSSVRDLVSKCCLVKHH